jgi:MFS family permease
MSPADHKNASSQQPRFGRLFPSIMLPMFLAVVDQTIVAAALPAIAGSIGSPRLVSWIVVAYLVAVTVTAPVYGRLGDKFGRKRLMLVALPIFAASSLLCAVSTSMPMLIGARALQGLGGGGLMTLSQALVGEAISPRNRGRYQGYLAGIAVTSSAAGPVLGGLLTQHFGWQSVFLFALPLSLLAWLMVLRLPTSPKSEALLHFDLLGLILFASFVISTLVLLQDIQRLEFARLHILAATLSGSLVSLVLLVYRETRAIDPLLPVSLFRNPSIWRCNTMAGCQGAVLVSLMTFMPIYYRVTYGGSAGDISLLLLPMALGVGLGSMMTGRLLTRTGRTAVFPSFGMIVASVLLVGIAIWSPHFSAEALSWTFGVTAFFFGTVMTVVQVTVQAAAGAGLLGSAAASVQLSRSLGAAFGTALVATVIFSVLSSSDPGAARAFGEVLLHGPTVLTSLPPEKQAAMSGEIQTAFRLAFLLVACFAAMTSMMAWTIPVRRV